MMIQPTKYLWWLYLLPLALLGQNSYDQAVRHYHNEQFQQAKPLFEAYLEQHPKHVATREYLGDIEGYTKNWNEALDYYKPLLADAPNNATYHFKVGGVLGMKALENKLAAITIVDDIKFHFEKAAQLDPQHIEARWALVEFYLQLPGLFGGSEKKAIRYAKELLQISPVDGYLSLGYIAEYSDRPEDAETYYKKAVDVGGSPHTYEKLSNLYEKNNRPGEAIQTTKKSLEMHQRNRLNYQIGKIAAQYNLEAQLGIRCLQAYIANHTVRDGVPKDWAYFRMAQIYKNMGHKDHALKWINKALRDRPDFSEAKEEKERILSL
ncbi:tetratricopeptide repeat protein [Altibacter sp. HG106]|uniref:tetratricopeptide repeat protein n=1 Tax=Altibacter sp. HG106 TaxID=3023937 RepID=UPI00234FF4F1|nr:tetratricopeptide repeat protein [Altibacter sp. HG106]MDC7995969.1 tetratricopeptide repeat protein [Altibacter sp. HG106]